MGKRIVGSRAVASTVKTSTACGLPNRLRDSPGGGARASSSIAFGHV